MNLARHDSRYNFVLLRKPVRILIKSVDDAKDPTVKNRYALAGHH
jgi:hypothetical protein